MNLNTDRIVLPANQIPSFRTGVALKNGTSKNILFTTWGGIGDQICAEPVLRYALETFKDVDISLYTELPELFAHLKFKDVYTSKNKPNFSKFFVLNTITNPETLVWEFVSHGTTHCVDFPSLCSIRSTLPISYKSIQLPIQISEVSEKELSKFFESKYIAIHAGKHWESKTFSSSWWEELLSKCINAGFTPVLFGKEIDHEQGTVSVATSGCVDLRNKLTLSESIWLLQRMKYLICNDSSPLHMAATGNAHIAFVASAKHHDYLYHWRRDENNITSWAWRMKHFNKGGLWEQYDICPNKSEATLMDKCDSGLLSSWLPRPDEIIDWLKGLNVS
jgi:ADP-heptose:LPS heptosyltransferase